MALFLQLLLLSVAVCLFGGGIGLAYLDNVAGASACFTAGGLVLIFAFLSQFKRFKGPFGIEGEMWEREMEEAQEIAEKFRSLASVVAKPLITNGIRLGRWSSGLSRREVDTMVRDVRAILEKAGSPAAEIEDALRDYRRFTAFDMARAAHTYVKTAVDAEVQRRHQAVEAVKMIDRPGQNEANTQAVESWRSAMKAAERVTDVFEIEYADHYPDVIIQRINNCPILDDEGKKRLLAQISDTLDDLAHFRDTGKIRRPDVWFNEPKEE